MTSNEKIKKCCTCIILPHSKKNLYCPLNFRDDLEKTRIINAIEMVELAGLDKEKDKELADLKRTLNRWQIDGKDTIEQLKEKDKEIQELKQKFVTKINDMALRLQSHENHLIESREQDIKTSLLSEIEKSIIKKFVTPLGISLRTPSKAMTIGDARIEGEKETLKVILKILEELKKKYGVGK